MLFSNVWHGSTQSWRSLISSNYLLAFITPGSDRFACKRRSQNGGSLLLSLPSKSRFVSAAEVRSVLRNHMRGGPSSHHPPSRWLSLFPANLMPWRRPSVWEGEPNHWFAVVREAFDGVPKGVWKICTFTPHCCLEHISFLLRIPGLKEVSR